MRTAFLLATLLTLTAAHAGECVPREFAQYQADAKRGAGRITVAFSYCSSKRNFELLTPGRAATQCAAEMQKALDALNDARDSKAAKFALQGCQGDMPNK